MRVIRYTLVSLGMVLLGLPSMGQMKKANDAFEHHHYEEAIGFYDKEIRRDLDNDEAITKMAICFWKTNQLPEAEYWFTRAALMNDDPEVKLMYAQVLIANEKYAKAQEWLDKYVAIVTDEDKVHHAHQLVEWAGALSNGAFQLQNCKVQPVNVNSYALDFAPQLIGNKLYFITNRKGVVSRSGVYDPWTNARFTDIYVADRVANAEFGEVRPATEIPLSAFHEGPMCMSPDSSELYMTMSDFNEKRREFDSENNTRVKVVRLVKGADGNWERTAPLSFYSNQYNTAHPAISPDGNTMVFASDMPGGQGLMDLYVTRRNPDGSWGVPEPLPPHINTRGNEVFPSFHKDGALYFASNWHAGFGGMDIFRCPPEADGWGIPENMGLPINSPRDDFGICLEEDGQSGFFTSNRGNEDKDDILFFKTSYGMKIEGTVVNCKTRMPIANAQVELRRQDHYRDYSFSNSEGRFSFIVKDNAEYMILAQHDSYLEDEGCTGIEWTDTFGMIEGQKVEIDVALSPEPAAKLDQVYVCGNIYHDDYLNPLSECDVTLVDPSGEETHLNTAGLGSFYVPVSHDQPYEMVIRRQAFYEFRQTLEVAAGLDQCHAVDIHLVPDRSQIPPPLTLDVVVEKGMVLELYHIYFDKDEADVRQDAMKDLETFYELLMKYPSMKGELMAHTDSRASAEYNMQLSQRRAESVRNYLISRGIDGDRLIANGYGETQLVNLCSDDVECTEEQHQRNRRVEFRVIDVDEDVDVKSKHKSGLSDSGKP
ncbi:OmpA family protein [Sanyastnella coralliicola]|uniref:OmpA family protein n=1 Tax=Sanyastnella coralliicola TaxID=3069118 RepID=UPI0027BA799D|nr:OmpA family protein [Longitalea sp. SCSIO 12813]